MPSRYPEMLDRSNLTGAVELTVGNSANPTVAAEELDRLLSPDERERAGRFRFPHLRRNFRISRGMLRFLLGRASGIPPDWLRFAYSSLGKPTLPDFPALHFNLSHSGDLWACVIGRGTPVGVDIEQIRPMADALRIARRFFAPSEYDAINRLPEPERDAAFFLCWTRKEAYLKALGDGLARGLATFEVSCSPENVSRVYDPLGAPDWFVHSFVPAPGYAGAVAVQGAIVNPPEPLGQ